MRIIELVLAFIVGLFGVGSQSEMVTVVTPTLRPTATVAPTPTREPIRSVLLEMPFSSQAPTGEWSDSTFQDACEETSVLMAYCGIFSDKCIVTNGKIDKAFARSEIVKISEYERKNFGTAIDSSAKDTAERILDGYYQYKDYEVVEIESKAEIIYALMNSRVIIAPTDGRKLNNPNFTNGGPERHKLLIIGYDANSFEFITNDPGTRNGEGYRYDEDVMFEAIRDYESGDHEPITKVQKNVIIVEVK